MNRKDEPSGSSFLLMVDFTVLNITQLYIFKKDERNFHPSFYFNDLSLIPHYLSGTGCMSPVFIMSKTVGKNVTRIK